MPRQIDRDFLPLAISQNCAAWSDLPSPCNSLEARCTPRFEAAAHRSQARYLARRRARLVERIEDTISWPGGFTRSIYFRGLTGSIVLSTDDAVSLINRAICRERQAGKHWSRTPGRDTDLVEALTFARYFRRFGQRVWARQAEAA